MVRVQQIAELGYDEDDVELALVDNKNDREKVGNLCMLINWVLHSYEAESLQDKRFFFDIFSSEENAKWRVALPRSLSK